MCNVNKLYSQKTSSNILEMSRFYYEQVVMKLTKLGFKGVFHLNLSTHLLLSLFQFFLSVEEILEETLQ